MAHRKSLRMRYLLVHRYVLPLLQRSVAITIAARSPLSLLECFKVQAKPAGLRWAVPSSWSARQSSLGSSLKSARRHLPSGNRLGTASPSLGGGRLKVTASRQSRCGPIRSLKSLGLFSTWWRLASESRLGGTRWRVPLCFLIRACTVRSRSKGGTRIGFSRGPSRPAGHNPHSSKKGICFTKASRSRRCTRGTCLLGARQASGCPSEAGALPAAS